MPNELKPMKAWLVKDKDEGAATVVFAETRGKARAMAMHTNACEDVDWCNIEVRRRPQLDKYYQKGKWEMDWYNSKDRIALVKDAGFVCDAHYWEREHCDDCPAKDYCDIYQDLLTEEGATMNKQIEERCKLTDLLDDIGRDWDNYLDECQEEEQEPVFDYYDFHADHILNAGYRKSTDVAKEIFEKIDELLSPYGIYLKTIDLEGYAKLKKKYESEGADDENCV